MRLVRTAQFCSVSHGVDRCSSGLKNSELDSSSGTSETTEGSQSDELCERASNPKSSRLDSALGRLEMTDGLRSDELGVGVCDGGAYSLSGDSHPLR
jgi:hypothetical protein